MKTEEDLLATIPVEQDGDEFFGFVSNPSVVVQNQRGDFLHIWNDLFEFQEFLLGGLPNESDYAKQSTLLSRVELETIEEQLTVFSVGIVFVDIQIDIKQGYLKIDIVELRDKKCQNLYSLITLVVFEHFIDLWYDDGEFVDPVLLKLLLYDLQEQNLFLLSVVLV